jgi:hypothetical protein
LLRGHWWAARFYPFKNENNDGVSIKLFCLTGDVSGQLSIWLQDQEIKDSNIVEFRQYQIYALSNLPRDLVENALLLNNSWRILIKINAPLSP